MTTPTTSDASLSAIRAIRIAWFDEKIDAEARGDAGAAARASALLDACEHTLLKLEQKPRPAGRGPLLRLFTRLGGDASA